MDTKEIRTLLAERLDAVLIPSANPAKRVSTATALILAWTTIRAESTPNATQYRATPSADVSAAIEEIHWCSVRSSSAAATTTVQTTSSVETRSVSILVSTTARAHRGQNAKHKIIWRYADVQRDWLEILTSTVDRRSSRSVRTTRTVRRTWLVSRTSALSLAELWSRATDQRDAKQFRRRRFVR